MSPLWNVIVGMMKDDQTQTELAGYFTDSVRIVSCGRDQRSPLNSIAANTWASS